jgi:hypothetical protein
MRAEAKEDDVASALAVACLAGRYGDAVWLGLAGVPS